jgi:hypothetical protein
MRPDGRFFHHGKSDMFVSSASVATPALFPQPMEAKMGKPVKNKDPQFSVDDVKKFLA